MAVGIKKPKDQLLSPVAMDMTPMIDCVFQLIIFFMLAIDLSQQDLEDLVLPLSQMALKDENPEEGRLYVNISRKGEYVLTRRKLELKDLEVALKLKNDLPRPNNAPTRDKDGLSERPLLIRADEASEFKHVQKVMRVCATEGLKIWKLELAASQPQKAEDEKTN